MGTGARGLPAVPESAAAILPVASLAELLPDGLVVVGGDQNIRFVNAEAQRVLGLSSTVLTGHPVRDVLPLADKYGRDWWQHTDPWGAGDTAEGQREKLLVGPGETDVLVTVRYVRGDSGRIERVLLGLRDAEARQRAEREQATVISTVAHELRAPLTSVQGFTSALLRRWDRFTDDQKRLMIETIEADANRLTRLITELLDISRLDSDNLTLRFVPVDLRGLLQTHVGRHEMSRAAGSVVLQVGERARHYGLPELWADADRLQQVFFNLIENALGHGKAPVTVTIERDGGDPEHVVVQVDDHGGGIAAVDRDKVFGRFWHGEGGATTGLGLYVVRGLVEAHGGTVQAGVNASGGARFTVRLPCGVPDAVALG